MESETIEKATTVVHTVKSGRLHTPAQPDLQVDNQLQRKLLTAVSSSERKPIAIELVISTLKSVLKPALVDYFDRDPTQALHLTTNTDLLEQLPPGAAQQLHAWANETCQSGNTLVHELVGAHQWTVVTAPVILRGQPPEALCAVFRKGAADTGRVSSTLQLGASHITLWYILREVKQTRVESANTSALLELLAKLDNSEDLKEACYILVNDLREYLGCRRIALGLIRSGNKGCRLTAVSGLSDFDDRSEFSEQLESVLNEAFLLNEVTVVAGDDGQQSEGTLAHRRLLAISHAKTLISTPVFSGSGDVVGAWLFLDDRPESEASETLHFVRASPAIVGSRLGMLRRAQVHPLMRPVHFCLNQIGTRKLALVVAACVSCCGAMAIPINYKISCQCQLEPVSRRFVAAPYDAALQESLVEVGQVVSAGQVLARMDARELRWQLSGLEADHESERKKRDAAAARDEVALSQQSDLEMQRMSLQIQLIRNRLGNLEVKSPVDGVVIAGDLKKSEGVPLTIGQTMFEIGPLDQMIVEVAIPEREILYVQAGMPVEIRLNAAQNKNLAGNITRIAPRSETRDSESIYIAEVKLDNRQELLRPGMKGTAKVFSDPHPIGWNLFHKAWESLAMLIGY